MYSQSLEITEGRNRLECRVICRSDSKGNVSYLWRMSIYSGRVALFSCNVGDFMKCFDEDDRDRQYLIDYTIQWTRRITLFFIHNRISMTKKSHVCTWAWGDISLLWLLSFCAAVWSDANNIRTCMISAGCARKAISSPAFWLLWKIQSLWYTKEYLSPLYGFPDCLVLYRVARRLCCIERDTIRAAYPRHFQKPSPVGKKN